MDRERRRRRRRSQLAQEISQAALGAGARTRDADYEGEEGDLDWAYAGEDDEDDADAQNEKQQRGGRRGGLHSSFQGNCAHRSLGGQDLRPSGLRRLRGDIQLDDGAYEGQKVSRSMLFQDNSDNEPDEDDGDEGEDDDEDEDEDEDDEMSDDSMGAGFEDSEYAEKKMNGTRTSGDLGREEEEDEDEGDDEQANEIEIVGRASRDKPKTTKAESVRTQKHLYDKGIEMRIRLQKPMEVAVKASYTKHWSDQSDSQLSAQDFELQSQCRECYNALAELLFRMCTRDTGNLSINREHLMCPSVKGKSSLDDAWAAQAQLDQVLEQVSAKSLDRWHRRAAIGAGLSAFGQGPSAQIAALRKRGLSKSNENFDDTNFYQNLLREVVQSGGELSAVGGDKNAYGPKQRKNVDRRASKGRKIRYDVQENLVGFMSATATATATATDQESNPHESILQGLFGTKPRTAKRYS